MKFHISNPKKIVRKTTDWLNRQLEPHNYDAAKAYHHRFLQRKILEAKQPPLLIYQMGKVGSSSINTSLKKMSLGIPIFHVHFLTKDLIELNEGRRRKFFKSKQEKELKRIWTCESLGKQIGNGLVNGNKWKIITLVRDPIARNISTFFETLEVEILEPEHRYKFKADFRSTSKFEIIVTLDNITELIEHYLKEFDHETPLEFLDRQIKTMLGVDVFTSDFSKQKGYKIYEGPTADVLLIRLESLNECVQEAFKKFLNIDNFTLVNTNIGGDKDYAPIYDKFKGAIDLPDSYIDEMYNSKYTRNFYTDTEISQFKTKWLNERNLNSSRK